MSIMQGPGNGDILESPLGQRRRGFELEKHQRDDKARDYSEQKDYPPMRSALLSLFRNRVIYN